MTSPVVRLTISAPDPEVRIITLGDFFAYNTLSSEELQELFGAFAQHRKYRGGGGASPEWILELYDPYNEGGVNVKERKAWGSRTFESLTKEVPKGFLWLVRSHPRRGVFAHIYINELPLPGGPSISFKAYDRTPFLALLDCLDKIKALKP